MPQGSGNSVNFESALIWYLTIITIVSNNCHNLYKFYAAICMVTFSWWKYNRVQTFYFSLKLLQSEPASLGQYVDTIHGITMSSSMKQEIQWKQMRSFGTTLLAIWYFIFCKATLIFVQISVKKIKGVSSVVDGMRILWNVGCRNQTDLTMSQVTAWSFYLVFFKSFTLIYCSMKVMQKKR